MLTRTWIEQEGLKHVNFTLTNDGEKKIPVNIPTGWMEWTLAKCTTYNETHGGNMIAINIKDTKWMCIDIDDPKYEKMILKNYGEGWQTKSSTRKLPHLYRLRDHEDPCKNEIDKDGLGVDFKYDQMWESADGYIDITPGETAPVYEGFTVESKEVCSSKTVIAVPVPMTDEKEEYCMRVLNNIDVSYLEDRDTWVSIMYGMRNEGMSEDAMEKVSDRATKYKDGDVQTVMKGYDETRDKTITWNTVCMYSIKSNPDEHKKIRKSRQSKDVKLELDDLSLAKTFLEVEKDNVCYVNNEVYIFRGEWRKDHKSLQLKNMICDILVKLVLQAQADHSMKMLAAPAEQRKAMEARTDILNKIYQRVSSSSGIDKVCCMVLQKMAARTHTIEFDIGAEQLFNLHFRNGCLELKTKTFRPRVQLDYVTQYLDWDYDPDINEGQLAWVREMYRKIQPNPEQRKFMLAFMAYCLCGDTSRQIFKMNIGYSAGNGKSTEFKIHHGVFPCYSQKLPKNVFDENNPKRHKSMVSVLTNPIRFLYVEELSTKKMDADYIKDLVDGANLDCEVMYGTKISHSVQAKLLTCSNKDFKTDVDEGITRRGIVQYYESMFRGLDEEDEDWFGEDKHQYLKDMDAPLRFADDGYKNAYLALLLEHFDTKFVVPKTNKEAFKAILHENDELTQYLEEHFVMTNDETDRVGRPEIMEDYFDVIKKRPCSNGQFNTMMRSRGYKWEKTVRYQGKKGCFVGLRRAMHGFDSENEE